MWSGSLGLAAADARRQQRRRRFFRALLRSWRTLALNAARARVIVWRNVYLPQFLRLRSRWLLYERIQLEAITRLVLHFWFWYIWNRRNCGHRRKHWRRWH